jgi:hypothetical protein
MCASPDEQEYGDPDFPWRFIRLRLAEPVRAERIRIREARCARQSRHATVRLRSSFFPQNEVNRPTVTLIVAENGTDAHRASCPLSTMCPA